MFSKAVNMTAVISFKLINLTQKYQDLQLEKLQRHMKFDPDQLISAGEMNQILLSADPVTPNRGKGHWKSYKMLEVNGAYNHGRYEKDEVKFYM